jgi:hypothetical protein
MNPSSDRSPKRNAKGDSPGHRNGRRPADSASENYGSTDLHQEMRGAVTDVSETVRAGAEEATAAAEDIAGAATEAITAAARAVASQASEIVGNVAGQLGSSVDEQKGRGADSLVGFAHAIKTAAAELEGQSPVIARKFRGASDQIERFSGRLRDRRVEDLITDYSNLARTQPVAFFAGALIAGFALSRFIKSSASSAGAASADRGRTGSEAGA